MAAGGEALGREEGRVLFVPFALPGERVEVEIVEARKNYARGRLRRILRPAPARVTPACAHFGVCGGCAWQHVTYAAQVEFKTALVREQLARVAHLPDAEVRACIPSPTPYGYRNSTRLAVDAGGRLGYRMAASHAIVPIVECPILEPDLQAELAPLLEERFEPGADVLLRVPMRPIALAAGAYHASPEAFFQVNSAVAERLIAEVLAALAPRPGERLLDLYAGVGLFTQPLAQAVGEAGQVLGIEASAAAVADAAANLSGLPQAAVRRMAVEAALALPEIAGADEGRAWDGVLLDPPRRGVERAALEALAHLGAARIVYVSCDPATLARDLALLAGWGYALRYVQPLDMFPQTAHVECVALLTRVAHPDG